MKEKAHMKSCYSFVTSCVRCHLVWQAAVDSGFSDTQALPVFFAFELCLETWRFKSSVKVKAAVLRFTHLT